MDNINGVVTSDKTIILKSIINTWVCPLDYLMVCRFLYFIDRLFKISNYWKVYFVLLTVPPLATLTIGLCCYDELRELPYIALIIVTLTLTAVTAIEIPLCDDFRFRSAVIRVIAYTSLTVVMISIFSLSICLMVLIYYVSWNDASYVNYYIGFFIASLFLETPIAYTVSFLLFLFIGGIELLVTLAFLYINNQKTF